MIGREQELAAVAEVCRAAGAGKGSVLVVVGEPGIGKTALLAEAASSARQTTVLRATCVEAEATLPFATLQALLWPLRRTVEALPPVQTALLQSVLQTGPTREASAFAVGAAVLGLISVASEDRPLLLAVDDAHWADLPSQEVLCFLGRRIEQERAAVVATVRADEPCLLTEERSFARLSVGSLRDDAAHELLATRWVVAPEVAERLVAICLGNPLGLLELPGLLTEAQRLGRDPLPAWFEAGPLVRRAFAARAQSLDRAARRALLILAVAGEADASLLARLDVGPATLDALRTTDLVVREAGTYRFRHPLMQSAIYGAATSDERRHAHQLVAATVDGPRRAWHLAEATSDQNESVARELEAAAAEARLTGGRSAEAQALERAAALTPDADRRARRLFGAGVAWRHAGRVDRATDLLEDALRLARRPETRFEIQLERGRAMARAGEMEAAAALLVSEADDLQARHPRLAARLLAEAAIPTGLRPDAPAAIALAERALGLAGGGGDIAELAATNAALVARSDRYAPPDERDLALARRASELLAHRKLRRTSPELDWLAYVLALFERDEEGRRLSDLSLAEARSVGDVWSLCYGLYARAAIEGVTGRVDAALTWAHDAVPLAEQIGEAWRLCEAQHVLAGVESDRGNVDACVRAFDSAEYVIAPAQVPFLRSQTVGKACLAAGRFAEAVEQLEQASALRERGGVLVWYRLVPLELAEAYVMLGRRREAEMLLRSEGPSIESCPLARPRARLARVRGLLAREAEVDGAFATARALLDQAPHPLERARVELCWGERLRRIGRSDDARPYLERALAGFDALGATGWAGRARAELEAAGGGSRPPAQRRSDELTAQELRIARHAAGGLRDREIAALLYLSPRTVHSHLQHAYRKLGISNRTQLAGILAADGVRPLGAPDR